MASNPTQAVQNEVLNTVSKSQEAVVDAIKAWADTVQSITPKPAAARRAPKSDGTTDPAAK